MKKKRRFIFELFVIQNGHFQSSYTLAVHRSPVDCFAPVLGILGSSELLWGGSWTIWADWPGDCIL
jgi:hypothetical protein